MDISDTLAPNSDQLDAVDLLGGPRTFTIERASKGNAEQPVQIHLAEFPRPWRPGKSMRRVLAFCWGADSSVWAGRRVRLYCDPAVVFGGEAVGGTRIAALSHLDRVRKVPLLVSRGRSAMFTVEPLGDAPERPGSVTAEQVAGSSDLGELRGWWKDARGELRGLIEARVSELQAAEQSRDDEDQGEGRNFPDGSDPEPQGEDPWAEKGGQS